MVRGKPLVTDTGHPYDPDSEAAIHPKPGVRTGFADHIPVNHSRHPDPLYLVRKSNGIYRYAGRLLSVAHRNDHLLHAARTGK